MLPSLLPYPKVMEEVGARTSSVEYISSQSWPFPQSCMVGFRALADHAEPLQVDEMEMDGADWFTRAEVC